MSPRNTMVADKLLQKMHKVVPRYVDEGFVELLPVVLVNNKVHMLDMRYFSYMNRSWRSTISNSYFCHQRRHLLCHSDY